VKEKPKTKMWNPLISCGIKKGWSGYMLIRFERKIWKRDKTGQKKLTCSPATAPKKWKTTPSVVAKDPSTNIRGKILHIT
jgi:hypothetical protein